MMIEMHTVTAVVAILCGFLVLALVKGTGRHKIIGKIYTGSLVSMVVLSFFIQQINDDGWSIFHLISIQVTLFVVAGLGASVFRSRIPAWYVWHARFMLYSFVTLIVTGIAQAFEYLPFDSDVVNAIVFIQIPAVAGWALIEFVGMPVWRRRFTSVPASDATVPGNAGPGQPM